MSKNKKIKEEKQIVYPTSEMDERGKLYIPPNVLAQINYLHGRVGKDEWSAMLLYDVRSGSPADIENFELEAKHVFLMDIGTAAYTEYETDGDIVDIYDNIEEAMEWKTGHIHSHHSMDAYFSGTDMSELNDNVDKHNYYLSLIVNFAQRPTAKVAFLSDVHHKSKMNYVDESGETQLFETNKVEKEMVTIGMDIYYDMKDDFFFNRYDQVIEKAEKAEAERKKKQSNKLKYSGQSNALGFDYGQGSENFYDPNNLTQRSEPAPFEGDPKNMTNMDVEKLSRNVFSVTPDLTEVRSVYQILHVLAGSKEADLSFYYDYLAVTLPEIISNFFDQNLEVDEMTVVIDEIDKSMLRFSTHPRLEKIIRGISEVLQEFGVTYTGEEDENEQQTIDSQLEAEAAAL
jgi:hypothetical protein